MTSGPMAQPRSPEKAMSEYMVVPPKGKASPARANVPGQKKAQAAPQTAQPSRAITGHGAKIVTR